MITRPSIGICIVFKVARHRIYIFFKNVFCVCSNRHCSVPIMNLFYTELGVPITYVLFYLNITTLVLFCL